MDTVNIHSPSSYLNAKAEVSHRRKFTPKHEPLEDEFDTPTKRWTLHSVDQGHHGDYESCGFMVPAHAAFNRQWGYMYGDTHTPAHHYRNCYCPSEGEDWGGSQYGMQQANGYNAEDIMCYHCGNHGHYASHCPRRTLPPSCFLCHQEGHFQVACPMRYENSFEVIPPVPCHSHSSLHPSMAAYPRLESGKKKFTPVKRRHDRHERKPSPVKSERRPKARPDAVWKPNARSDKVVQTSNDLQAIMAHVRTTDIVRVKLENCMGARMAEKLDVFAERPNGGLYTKLGPLEFGKLVVEGVAKVKVHRRPRVLLFHIGDKNSPRKPTGLVPMLTAMIIEKDADFAGKVAVPLQAVTGGDDPSKAVQNLKKGKDETTTGFSLADHKKRLFGSELVIVTNSTEFKDNEKELPKEILKKMGSVILDDIPQWPGVSFGVSNKKKKGTLLLCSLPGDMELEACHKFFETLISPVLEAMHGVPVERT